ncbi:hypothetical protein BDW02DRAFT_101807 [Decorospora gaudefroyi]|uniref:Uncharacterized protein n=1 Tax=Decorospora gaudefroyi TaxID=184978 RepID=A0A6A5JZJ8_9PLEO|nr:hypothetical protein BDW02DRAFT_101807 [Decorospora gaudefroyi]
MSPAWRVASPYCLALAPQVNSPEPVWYVGCKTLDGEDKLFYSQTYFDIHYPDLARWTKSIPGAARSCFVTFGQHLGYFACAPGHGSIWAGIPSELEDTVRKSFDAPSCVSLGMKDAWFVLYPDGRLAWNFHGHYSALNKILADVVAGSVTYVAISPYNKEHYFIAFRDRSIKYNFKGAPAEWMRLMTEVFDIWAAARLQMQQSPPPQLHPQPYLSVQEPQPYLQQQSPNLKKASPLLVASPTSPPVIPGTPLPMYTSPVQQSVVPIVTYANKAQERSAINVPMELPGDTLLSAPILVPGHDEISSTKKKKSFLSRLF